jgi:ATP/maltotriose-dependent transcriptional regulator MalT
LDVAVARDTYLDAWFAGLFAGQYATTELHEIARAAKSAPLPPHVSRPSDVLLDGLAILVTEGRVAAAPALREAARRFAEEEIASLGGLRWGWVAQIAPLMLWDEERWDAILARQLRSVREAGLLVHLPIWVNSMGILAAWRGDLGTAASLIAEADAIAAATGISFARYAAVFATSLQGGEAEARPQIDAEVTGLHKVGQGLGVQWCQFVSAVLYNGNGRYEEALPYAQRASEEAPELFFSMWALPELVEAALRSGKAKLAAEAVERLTEATAPGNTDWGVGIAARSQALVSQGERAERLYREAIERLTRTSFRPELARAHLLYGEWLRRQRRRGEARAQLRTAYEMLDAMGMKAFADRARRELAETGETVREHSVDTSTELTAQEAQVARLARDGLSNPEISARLFISARTVQYHLSKVFTKLDITSRAQLDRALL